MTNQTTNHFWAVHKPLPRLSPVGVRGGSRGGPQGSGTGQAGSENEILGSDSIDDTLGEKKCPFMVIRASVFHKILPSKSGRQRSWRCVQLTNAAEIGEFWREQIKIEADHFARPQTRPLRKDQ